MPNQLIHEKSPYLLQHAHNPVDWHAWGPEAFEKAKREDKPIFLSVGYSTCHWCHVMERESFESEEMAKLLNAFFVPVKVDREERPDVDRIYMTFVQATTGSGGWPMSVFLTPELKPFFGGTYFPPDNRYGRPGFASILQSLARAWKQDRAKIDKSSADVIAQLAKYTEPKPARAGALDQDILDAAFQYFRRSFDATNGGFGGAPKFPRPVALNFLLRYAIRNHNEDALDMALRTLRGMAEGGMNDQLGGGFHRYSVDEMWFLPHFEKMLYDQAQLAVSYVEAFQITGEAYYASIARNTLDYVLRDMTDPHGAFYSAEDADSVIDPAHPHEKGEGAFYVWTQAELEEILGPQSAGVLIAHFGVEKNGNVHHDPHGEFPGKNILYGRREIEADAAANLQRSMAILLEHRSKRVRPHLDDKILTAWNGLMISAFAKAAQALDAPHYAQAARRAADFLVSTMYDRESGVLLRRYRDGEAAIPGFLDDYVFLAQALLDLYETEFRVDDLELADALMERALSLFEDRAAGAFFSAADGDASIVMRMKDDYDGAEPSGNSIALLNLQRLVQLTGKPEYERALERAFAGLASRIADQPVAVPQMLVALQASLGSKRQIVLVGEGSEALLREVRSRFLPETLVLRIDSEASRERLARWMPWLSGMVAVDGKAAVYVCQNFACQLPVTDVARLGELLQ
jgi:uncharacterized protein YyaL (SSP411 family)